MKRLALAPLFFVLGCAHAPPASDPVALRVIAINDFHGNLEPPARGVRVAADRVVAAGGAAYLAAHVDALRARSKHALVVSAGDLVGASPLLSGLFHDEPTIEAMNRLGLDLNGVGNHEFDEGLGELKRLVAGGCHPDDGCRGPAPYQGARFGFLAANVVDDRTGRTVFPGYAIRTFSGVRVGVIGLTLEGTKDMLPPVVPELSFLDEAETVNRAVAELKQSGVRAIVVLLHEGGFPKSDDPNACDGLSGPVTEIVPRFDPEVDLVVSGHTHQAYVCQMGSVLLTSGGSFGRIVTDIELTLDPGTGDVVSARAENRVVDHGLPPDRGTETLVAAYREVAAPLAERVITRMARPLTKVRTDGGVSDLGRVIADAQLAATRSAGAELALMNSGGVRAAVAPVLDEDGLGDVTYAMLFAAQPFGNVLMTLDLTGAELLAALEGQFGPDRIRFLDGSSNLAYQWRPAEAPHVLPGSVRVDGAPLELDRTYRVTVNAYMASKPPFDRAGHRVGGPIDLDALVAYLSARRPFAPPSLAGVERVGEPASAMLRR